MKFGKILQRGLIAFLSVIFLLSAAIAGAAVQIFDGVGDWHTNDDDNQQIAMARAQQRAQINAQKKAGIYLKTFSRSVNSELTDEEISAVTNNIIEVFDVHFDKKIIPLNERQTTILYTATLKAKIDPEGIYDFIKRDSNDKVTIVQQNTQLQNAIQKNDELTEKLTDQYNRAASQAEKDRIRKQLNDADRDFLANQKLKEGTKLAFAKDYYGAIKIYNEALRLNPNFYMAYTNRGNVYKDLGQHERAIQDFNKALEFKEHEFIYYNRGDAYRHLNQYERAIQNYNKAIQLNPNFAEAYLNRGCAYDDLGQNDRAIQDYDKAIQLNPNYDKAYLNRGTAYGKLKKFERAIQDFNKAIELNPNYALAYYNRGIMYLFLGKYDPALESFTKVIQIDPNNADAFNWRGAIYKHFGDEEKAQADFAKAKELSKKG